MFCQQTFWIYRLSCHKIRIPTDLFAEVFLNQRYIWTLIWNNRDKMLETFYVIYDTGIPAEEG